MLRSEIAALTPAAIDAAIAWHRKALRREYARFRCRHFAADYARTKAREETLRRLEARAAELAHADQVAA